MKSMTGYGRGEHTQEGYQISVEISTVNRRQAEINVYLPRELEALDARVRNEISRRIARGRVTARVTLHVTESALISHAQVNIALAKAYARELKKLARELQLSGELTLDTLARAPGVFQADTALTDASHFWTGVEAALHQALDCCIQMRTREGAHLLEDLRNRIACMKTAVEKVQTEAPAMVERYREQLRERIKTAGFPLPPDEDERLQKEIIYFADRSDISEELTRLQSHFNQFEECSQTKDPVGRTLDFLAQEINREVNTIGSKASDSTIAREVVLLKTELEKFREQVQNVE